MLSGGSLASVSEIWFAITVTVQSVPAGSGAIGVSVKLAAGEALSVNACTLPGAGHSIVNELVVAATDSLKLIVIVAFCPTFAATFVGVVDVTVGAASMPNEKT